MKSILALSCLLLLLSCTTLSAQVPQAINYQAIARDNKGKFIPWGLNEDIDELIPNIITPNGDGLNDIFDPLAILWENGLFYPETLVELVVLYRWVEVVFYTMPYQSWTGTGDNGRDLPQGTYNYKLLLHNVEKTEEIEGPINLLK